LQTLCLGIFDAILVSLMNQFAQKTWQPIRHEICTNLNMKKNSRTADILMNSYNHADVMFLQEVGKGFLDEYETSKELHDKFHLKMASNADPARDQNSLILFKKSEFKFIQDLTEETLAGKDPTKSLGVANGDLIVLACERTIDGGKYLFASFHGDTNGLATIPVVELVHSYAVSKKADHKLIFGMDANTYAHAEADQQGVNAFADFYTSLKLNSCYGKKPYPENYTTFHARTYLQPQLNKAITYDERNTKGDKNPKDFIVYFDSDFRAVQTKKDNTGERKYIEGMVFPTMTFPSDHGITSTTLIFKNLRP